VTDPEQTLVHYLQGGRGAVVWKLDGLSEPDVRRPLTPTGTSLLGLVKHLTSVELGYFGETFGRPSGIDLPWYADGPTRTPTCGRRPTRRGRSWSTCTAVPGGTPP
jgi:hypothetical protein